MDITVSTLVLLIFATFETMRLKMRRAWLILAAVFLGTFGAGVSSGFPLFLYLRQKHLDK
jgi:chromate transport protein ChrA